MNYVLDASITLSWCFSDETAPNSEALLERLEEYSAFVPELWTLEIGNILLGAVRKKRVTYAQMAEFLALLEGLNIQIDRETANRGFSEILYLAHSQKLTTYDAAYLELALREKIGLATLDKALSKAAKKVGVQVLV